MSRGGERTSPPPIRPLFPFLPLSRFHLEPHTTGSKSLLRSCDRRILRARGARSPGRAPVYRAERVTALENKPRACLLENTEARKGGRCSMDNRAIRNKHAGNTCTRKRLVDLPRLEVTRLK